MTAPSDELLAEQLEYYRARAGEYDEWWERLGRYDRGPEANAAWWQEIAEVRAVFDEVGFGGDVLELAPGTGYWTSVLAQAGASVTAVDGSAEMLDINRTRLGASATAVEYVEADLFEWVPARQWDGLVFCFWISHVPEARLASFLRMCADALRPGAAMFFLDGQHTPTSTAADHVLPEVGSETMTRRLNDGREFRIVKNFHAPEALIDAALSAGFDLEVGSTSTYFQYGVGRRR